MNTNNLNDIKNYNDSISVDCEIKYLIFNSIELFEKSHYKVSFFLAFKALTNIIYTVKISRCEFTEENINDVENIIKSCEEYTKKGGFSRKFPHIPLFFYLNGVFLAN